MHKNNIYKKLARVIKPYFLGLFLAITGVICTKLIEAAAYKFLAPKLVDNSFFTNDLHSLKMMLLTIWLITLLWALARFVAKYSIGYATKNISKDLRSKILSHMLLVPISFFYKNAIGNLISKVNYDVEQISRALADSVVELLSSIVGIIFFIGVMFTFSWQLTLIALTVAPLIGKIFQFVNIKIRKYSDRVQQSIGDISHLTHEVIEASQVIRIFEAIPSETKRIHKLMLYNIKQELKTVLISALSESSMRLIIGSVIVFLIYIATNTIFKISPGSFVGLCGAMNALLRPIKQLTEVNYVIARGLAAASSVFELLELPVEQNNPSRSIVDNSKFKKSTISLHNVDFVYPHSSSIEDDPEEKLILKNINLTFKPGKITAIVGRSGSGKSTLVSLLPRFYQLNSGSITLNGININDLDLQELRRQFAVVNQHIILLNDTVANNIAYGCMNSASREEIVAAANLANAMEFIEQLPNGLDTYIGNNGNLLSGGQRQRIAIARAILKNAPILILDEATSALDPHSEQLIQTALLNLKPNITIIIIAHRMSTIESADQVVVLEAGQLVAVGTHKELSENSYYTNLHKAAVNEIL